MKPIYDGHQQPKKPVIGEYNLDDQCSTITSQWESAREIGIDGFCFYYYQFNSTLSALRKPINDLIKYKSDVPFCICWANHSWTKAWVGDHNTVIAKQDNSIQTIRKVANDFVEIVRNSNYIYIDDKPVFVILNHRDINLSDLKNELETALGHPVFLVIPDNGNKYDIVDLYISWPPGDIGLKNIQSFSIFRSFIRYLFINKYFVPKAFFKYVSVGDEKEFLNYQHELCNIKKHVSQTLLSGWDNTPRYNTRGYIIKPCDDSIYINKCKSIIASNVTNSHPTTFIKAWNEWAEGNTIEPAIDNVNYYNRLRNILS